MRARIFCTWAVSAVLSIGAHAQAPAASVGLVQQAARSNPEAAREPLLAIARAGQRLVAVGDHGVVVLSDDGGKTFRQARTVPTRVTLTGVSFADGKIGWASGHWGTILRTTDGGETWVLQRTDTGTDRPLFAIHAIDAERAVAVGLWSLIVLSDDGGQHWREVQAPPPPDGGRADRNLLGIFVHGSTIYVAAERGLVLRSDDGGNAWAYLATGYKGSFWAGLALPDGTLLVGGLRGTLYRSGDAGKTWQPIDTGAKSSITGFADTADGLIAVGLDGTVLRSTDHGASFSATQRDDHGSLTAIAANAEGRPVVLSKNGIVQDTLRFAAAGH